MVTVLALRRKGIHFSKMADRRKKMNKMRKRKITFFHPQPLLILKELKVGQDWLLNNIKARTLSYFGHLKRHYSLEKHILESRLEVKRRKGRPTRRWTEDIKKWLKMIPTEAGRDAQKRQVFRRMVRETTSTQTCQDD